MITDFARLVGGMFSAAKHEPVPTTVRVHDRPIEIAIADDDEPDIEIAEHVNVHVDLDDDAISEIIAITVATTVAMLLSRQQ